MDLKTVIVLVIFSNFFISIFLFLFVKLAGFKNRDITIYTIAKFLFAAGFSLLILRNIIPDFFTIRIANIIIIFALAAEIFALTAFNKNNIRKYQKHFFITAFVLSICFSAILNLRENVRIAYMSSVIAMWFFVAAKQFLFNMRKDKFILAGGIIYIIFALIAMSRAVFVLVVFKNDKLFTPNIIEEIAFSAFFINIFISIVYLLLLKIRAGEIKLKISKTTLDKVQKISGIGSWTLNLKNKKFKWSDEMYQIFEIPKKEKITTSIFYKNTHPDDLKNLKKINKDFLQKGKKNISFRIQVNNETKWIHENAEVEYDKKNKPITVSGISYDISKMHKQVSDLNKENILIKKLSEQLKQSEIKYKALVENSHDGIYIYKGNKFLFVNKVIIEILGYTEEELFKMNIWDIIHPDDVKRLQQYSNDRFAGKSAPNICTSKILTKKNEIKIAEFSVKTINLFDEQVLFGVVRDITEREKADLKIKESEKKYKALFNGINDAVYVHPLKEEGFGNFIEVNDIACKRLGYSKKELLNMTAKQISIKSSSAEQGRKEGRKELLNKQWRVFESVHITKSGKEIPVEISSTVILYERKLSILSLVKDITKRKETEAELFKYRNNLEKIVEERTKELETKKTKVEESQKAMRFLLEDVNEARNELFDMNKKLSDTNKDLESFAYSVSHDLKSPLRAINGYTNVLLEDFPEIFTGEKKEFLDLIIQNSSKMNILIDDLLRFSRVGRNELDKSEFDLSVMVNDIIKQQSEAYSNHTINKTVQEKLIIFADLAAIKQVLINLISNALKFSSEKEQISIEFGKTQNNKKECFFIKDKGEGFNMKYADKLFGVFQRLHSSNKYEGTGVGLSLVKRILNKHGGDIWAESEIGKGSTFYFTVS